MNATFSKLVVIIPCLNEEATIQKVISAIPSQIEKISEIKVLVVDDGSTDHTAGCARDAGAVVLRNSTNRGLGRAFALGIDYALQMGADIVVNIDGDGQFNSEDISRLVEPILRNEADCVTASRFLDPALTPQMPLVKKWGNRRVAQILGFLTGKKFRDVSCGFRAYSREALLNLNLIGNFTYTQETFLDLAFKGFRILEVPLKVRGVREFGDSRMASSVFRYAMRTGGFIIRTFRDYQPLTVFGTLAFGCFSVGLALLMFLFIHYLKVGDFSPHKWAGFSGGFLLGCGLIIFTIGLSADMMHRQRIMNERILYLLRKDSIEKNNRDYEQP
ncbi:MAG: hypothetical protein A3G33_02060 [Omnitrophica bacterium RIFCSPLOWO2_12_FULL_44_17]|uniref:Glycosyltransferase 2-like domain-containing protein n=1 Tax=Candidatus Danuiimicrobium aquiferis TaxID=1801832 RepID=A0A1G1KTH1_9BACT|nr:MAG: hypothetical protein A3B72_04170 [Omnitrophica bacterium RIFCSPHIGHO2_02_FULL_45_28]OGW88642.1 MAG: hypothetical protein A3E74_03355 [Omnitrophica bacterium RIFCSPHIGHO2_12_FULL_44_12]OGW96145.1 MAG: hypothetical protein A3G33_02060 [Omnitrophica bacterium RIFCSPLOWO2_12_FULL_44_17]OGX04668.1 MAG: hypothetical protein A3J12_11530 [Omnitrophica bacterium RIFCSPLOWO2_02_FULL_44_11]